MIFVTSINIIANLLILSFPLYWSAAWLKMPIFNPISIIVLASLPFSLARLMAPTLILSDDQFLGLNMAILNENIFAFFGMLNLFIFYKTGTYRYLIKLIPHKGNFTVLDFSRLARLFLILFIVTFLYLMQRTGGVVDWVNNIRESYMAKRDGNGVFFATALSFLSLAIFFRVSICKSRSQIVLTGIAFTLIGSLFGTKGFLLQILVFIIVIYLIRYPRYALSKFCIILPIILLVLVLNFFNGIAGFNYLVIVEYFNYYYNAAIFYTDYLTGSIELFQGKILASSLWHYVPRNIFPDKPYVYGVLYVVEHYYPGGPASGNTPAFLGQVSRFADFGYPGFLLLSFLNVKQVVFFVLATQLSKFSEFTKGLDSMLNGRVVLCSIILLAPGFGTFFPLFLFLLLSLTVFVFAKIYKNSIRVFATSFK
jgi:hypothetical protein